MNLSNITNRMSGLKLPSKIKRPTSISLQKHSAPSGSGSGQDGFNSTVKKLNNDLIKTRIREDTDNDDDTITTTIRISPEITTARKKNDSISSWDGDRKHGENGTRRSSDASIVLTEDTDSFIVGDRVWVGGTKPGVIAFIGETQFGPGDWAGIVLDEPIGKNDGAVAGKRYFQCESNHGIFSRLTRLSRVQLDYTPVTPRSNGTPFTSTPNHITSSVTSVNSSLKTPTGSSMGSADIKLGDRVIVQSSQGSKPGMLRYYGRTEFGTGIWCGVELDDPLGKNDGSVDGVKYFECASKFGLFVPVEKVSRSPANNKKASCIVHPAGISRQGTQESFRSISTIGTTASSVKSNARVRLGVNSLGQRPGRQSAVRSTPPVAPKSPLQVELKEKEAYIKQLLKEKEMERDALIRAASQAEEFEKKLIALQDQHNRLFAEKEVQNETMMCAINKLEKEKVKVMHQLDEERRKAEDLQFSFEEESLTKSEIQTLNEQYKVKLEKFEMLTNGKLYGNGEKVESELRGNEEKTISAADEEETNELKCKLAELERELDRYKMSAKLYEERLQAAEVRSTNVAHVLQKKDYLQGRAEMINEKMEERLNNMENEKSTLKKELHELRLAAVANEEKRRYDDGLNSLSNYLKRLCRDVEAKNRILTECTSGKRTIDDVKDFCTTTAITIDGSSEEPPPAAMMFLPPPLELKETLTDLTSKIDDLVDANVTILDKIGTLTDVISRKDDELADLSKERDQLLKDYSELTKWRSSVGENLEAKYYTLLSTKEDLESQLRISRENIRKLESLFSSKDESSKLEIENMKSILTDKISDYESLFSDFSDKINHLSNEIQRRDEETTGSMEKQCETIRRLNAELNETLPDLEKTRREKEQLESDLSVKQVEIDNLNEICSELKENLKELESLLKDKDTVSNSSFNNYRDESISPLRTGGGDSAVIDARLNDDNPSGKATDNNLTIDNSNRENEIKLIDLLERIIAGGNEDGELVVSSSDDVSDTDANTMAIIVSRVQLKVNSLRQAKNLVEDKLREKESELTDCQLQIKSLNEKIANSSSHFGDLENECDNLRRACENAEKSIIALQCKVENLDASRSEIETKYKEMELQNMKLEEEHQASYGKLEEQLMKLKDENSAISTKYENASSQLYTLEKDSHSSLDKKVLELNALNRDAEILKQNADARENQLKELQAKLDNASKKFEAEKVQLEERISDLENEKLKLLSVKDSIVNELNGKLESQYEMFEQAGKLHQESKDNLQNQINRLLSESQISPKRKKPGDKNTTHRDEKNDRDDHHINRVKDNRENDVIESTSNCSSTDLQSREELLRKAAEEGSQSECEIKFLNSVIVGMHEKNQDLLARINYLETRIENEIPKNTVKTKIITPRLFCDICDMFDLHDTDDCPKQSDNKLDPPVTAAVPNGERRKPPERPYCDICEMFGHDTSDCDDNVTF